MRYFICWLSSLVRPFRAIVPVCVLWASSCPNREKENKTLHPSWFYLDESEENLPKDKCIVTKLGTGGFRFHVTDLQKCFNANNFYTKDEKNIVQTDPKAVYWVLTPNFYGSVTKEKFPKTMASGMKYKYYDNEKGGIPVEFLEEWLAVDDYKNAILIISKGIDGKLGVSESLKKALKDEKDKGNIQGYKILRTMEALRQHNSYVQEGEKVFTFIHTTG